MGMQVGACTNCPTLACCKRIKGLTENITVHLTLQEKLMEIPQNGQFVGI
jgi:hypothetical protein